MIQVPIQPHNTLQQPLKVNPLHISAKDWAQEGDFLPSSHGLGIVHHLLAITWSVKRSKLNKVIYEHQKEKLFKFPRQLELENGGKHPPKITLYLHPYGFEKDARHNLTLTITLDISVKCHIPTSATIVVEVVASDSSTGAKLKSDSIKCPANCRFARCMSFLSHKQLKDLECESIEFTAAAKLYTTGLND